jgi:Trk K+ transport system NAD-binding subunit
MMKKFRLHEKLRYMFDNTLSKGPVGILFWLGLLTLLIIVVITTVVYFTGLEQGKDWLSIAWMNLMRTLDAGTLTADQGSWIFLLVMFVVTMGGIFVFSAFIGVITTGLEGKIESLRKGRSRVVEKGHTVILGFNEQIFTIISELVEANASEPRSRIVIMGDKDKVEMEDEIRSMIKRTGRTRIVCRQGNPIQLDDLQIVSLDTAKSIIVLSLGEDDPDSYVIKTLLAITNNPQRKKEKYHIVAEIRDPRNYEVAKMVGQDEVEIVLVGNLVSRIIAQTCRQSGLSVVYTELMDFGGDEIYFTTHQKLIGRTYKDLLPLYGKCAVMGIFKDDKAVLNPPMDTVFTETDQLIVIAEDDSTVKLSKKLDYTVDSSLIAVKQSGPAAPEKTLILGWNWRAAAIIRELDAYVAAGSEVTVVAEAEGLKEELTAVSKVLARQKVLFKSGDTTDRGVLDLLSIASFDHIILLSYSDALSHQEADAKTIITLLHLRDMQEKAGSSIPVVSEMLDINNRNLAEVTKANDFIVSDKLLSLLLSQISENKHLSSVFEDMFYPDGAEIYLKPADLYVKPGSTLDFYTLMAAGVTRNETVIGYKIQRFAREAEKAYGIVINPEKAEPFTLGAADKVIVLAED